MDDKIPHYTTDLCNMEPLGTPEANLSPVTKATGERADKPASVPFLPRFEDSVIRRNMRTFMALLAWLLCARITSAQNDATVMVFQHANVIDGYSDVPRKDVSVHVAGGKIVGIETAGTQPPAGAEVIDLKGKWLLPGFIDVHVHFKDIAAAKTAVLLGATTVRTMHCEKFLDIEIREAHRQGQRELPEVVAGGYQIRPDMAASFFDLFPTLADLKPRVAGTEGVRRVVRALASRGVDHIKFLASERSGTPETDPRKRTFSDEEIGAIVDEARRAGLPACAHAYTDEAAKAAITAGVRSIEHGAFLGASTLQLMHEKGTFFCSNVHGRQSATFPPDNPILLERQRAAVPLKNKLLLEADRLDIPVAAGTDLAYVNRDLSMADEAVYMHKAGLPPMKILHALTSVSARCLGIEKRTGSIKVGMEADIVIVDSDPLTRIETLKDLRMILNDGIVVLNQLHVKRAER